MQTKTSSFTPQRAKTLQEKVRQVPKRHHFDIRTGFQVHRLLPRVFLAEYRMNAESFIEGFRALRESSPRISVSGYQNQNCPYGNAIYLSKNCYLCFDMDDGDNCMYCGRVNKCRSCVDCEDIWNSELCYEGVEIYGSYGCDHSQFLRNCSDVYFCVDCLNCHDCFGCVGLRRAKLNIFNTQYSQEDYKNKLAELRNRPIAEILARVEELKEKCPFVASRQYQTDHCVGDNIQNSKDCFYCFNLKNTNVGGYLYDVYTAYGDRNDDIYDVYFSVDLHQSYQCIQTGDAWNSNFCHYCEHLVDSSFCEGCFNSKYLFGCTFTNRHEYMILNKPYSKEDWHKETDEIKRALVAENKYNWDVFGK